MRTTRCHYGAVCARTRLRPGEEIAGEEIAEDRSAPGCLWDYAEDWSNAGMDFTLSINLFNTGPQYTC